MIATRTTERHDMFSRVENGFVCPDCGSSMLEVERISENGFAFIWYKCTHSNCGGQWLEKRVAAIRDF